MMTSRRPIEAAFCCVIAICVCELGINPSVSQTFRQPEIPVQSNAAPGSSPTYHGQFSIQDSNQSTDGFVPATGKDGLGMVPVRPRTGNLQGQNVQQFRPDYSGGRTGDQERILQQIRSGEFDAENGTFERQTGPQTIRQRYENGRDQLVRVVMQDENGNYYNHGPWRLYNRAGEPMATGQFVDGVMDGTWERWHSANSGGMFRTKPFTEFEGPFVSTATFANGKLDGVWVISDRNRRKIVEVPYDEGKRNGTATWWYPNSKRMRVINFKDGQLDGPMLEWNARFELVRNDEFIKGQKVVRNRTMYRPKQPSSETYYLDAELSLEGEDSWWDAEPAEYIQVGNRIQHGPTFAWFANGQRKMVGQYQDNVRVGKFTWWHENGQRALAGRYEDGLKTGVWTWWHENGMKSIEGEYADDRATGKWTWWDSNGQVKNRDDFGEANDAAGVLVDPFANDSTDETLDLNEQDSTTEPPEAGIEEMEEIRPDESDDDVDT